MKSLFRGGAVWLPALGLLVALLPTPARALGRLGVPIVDSTGVVHWVPRVDSLPAWAHGLVFPPVTRADSLALWRAAADQPGLQAVALCHLGQLWLAEGDTARADSCWASVPMGGLHPDPWRWPAVRGRAEIAIARGQEAKAETLLEHAPRLWGTSQEASRYAMLLDCLTIQADTTEVIRMVRRAVVDLRLTGAPVARLESVMRARGDSLTFAEEEAIAVSESHSGAALSAARREARLLARVAPEQRPGVALATSVDFAAARRFPEAREAARTALREATNPWERDQAAMAVARAFAATGEADSAISWYAGVVARAQRPVADFAALEAGRVAEGVGRWDEALCWYLRRGFPGLPNIPAGLMYYVRGQLDSAAACLKSSGSDQGRFWWAVTQRGLGRRIVGDAALSELASRPEYTFYVVAARETLGMLGWPGGEAAPLWRAGFHCPSLGYLESLAHVGAFSDVGAWAGIGSWNPTMDSVATCRYADAWLECASLAYAADRIGRGIADVYLGAMRSEGDASPRETWSRIPWLYPPAYEFLFVAPHDTVVASLEPALLFALVYHESRFDPRARSRSDALGLTQLKVSTAADMAKLCRDPPPTEATLFDPERNVRYGARYLARLLRRFDGHVAVALSAYNAGPSTVPASWRDLLARGGEALFCEVASNPSAQEYVKTILGVRQAYRELRPTTAP